MSTDVKNKATETEDAVQEKDPNQVVLLGSISYNDEKEYMQWLSKMDVSQAIFVLVAGANFAQSKGLLNLAESELISSAIRSIKNGSTDTTATEMPTNEETK
jgi:hypothetical protein